MQSNRDIERYDRLLLAELGNNPVYSWKWSEDLLHVMEAMDQSGQPEMETVLKGSVYVVQQKKRLRKVCPHIIDQWVICALIELGAEDGQVHGTGLASWMPVHDRRSHPVALPVGVRPNMASTEDFIKQMRAIRAKSAAQMDADFLAAEERREKQINDRNLDAIRDACTAYYEVPGKKGSTSFPGQTNLIQ